MTVTTGGILASALLPSGFGIILLEAIILVMHCLVEGFLAGSQRKVFNKAFYEKHFPNIKTHARGYPDNGYGRFSDKLSDEEWLKVASGQRVHYNYLEQLPAVVTLLLIAGLRHTGLAAVLGAAYFVGRVIYGIGYRAKGPTGRGIGVLVFEPAFFLLMCLSISTAWHLIIHTGYPTLF